MLSVWYILILNIYALKFIRCDSLKNTNRKKEDLRIVGGRDALPGEYPYVLKIVAEVLIEKSPVNLYVCTCACIKPTWSLTAAHCISSMKSLNDSEKNKIFVGYNPSYTDIAYVHVLSMVENPNSMRFYQPFLVLNDIGILKTENIVLSSYARVSSVDYSTLYGLKISALGYGLMLDGQGSLNDTLSLNKTLQVVDAMIIKCDVNVFPKYCLAGACEKWTSLGPGDSGGPVIHSSGIVGITSAGYQRIIKSKSFMGVLTPVSPFMDWIVNVIK